MIKIKNLLVVAIVIFFLCCAAFLGYNLSYKSLVLPNVFVSGVDLGGYSRAEAEKKLVSVFSDNQNKVVFVSQDSTPINQLDESKIRRDFLWASEQVFAVGRSGNWVDIKDRFEVLYKKRELSLPLDYNESELDQQVDVLAFGIDKDPIRPSIVINKNNFVLVKGQNGRKLNRETLKKEIIEKLKLPGEQKIQLLPEDLVMTEDTKIVENALNRLNSWGKDPLEIKYKDAIFKLGVEEVAKLIDLTREGLNPDPIKELSIEISEKIETEPKDAVFEFENGRVKEFKSEVVGIRVDKPKLEKLVYEEIFANEDKIVEVPVILNYPKILAGDINNLGIKELIGVGKSSFSHSIPNRVFNVNLAATRINGVVVAPGEEFSFVKSVGEINRETGYQSAYVISGGKTVLGDGGGVCQVSTTVFRAALDFGFPIVERKAHAYRVGYYEQDSSPGIDATVYYPTTDFKFLNDTGHHILVQAKVDTKNLTMTVEIYGTSDGRTSSVSKPVITGQVGAPAASYVDDPNISKGTTKQVDFAAAGAKVVFDYKVDRGGETLFEKRFISNYQPWRAVYLVGTKE